MGRLRRWARRTLRKLLFCLWLPGCLVVGPAVLQSVTDQWVGIGPPRGLDNCNRHRPTEPGHVLCGDFWRRSV
jgi:hypothetical protein